MDSLKFAAVVLAITSIFIGGSCLFLVHCRCQILSKIGRRLFLVSLVALGAVGMPAAMAGHEGLAPLGLLAGLLVVAMLWELPPGEAEQSAMP